MANCKFCGEEFKNTLALDYHRLRSFSDGCKQGARPEPSDKNKEHWEAVEKIKEGEEYLLPDGRVMKRVNGYIYCVAEIQDGIRREI